MTTPDFEEWLMRQDIPVEDTLTVERYQDYLHEEFGVKGGSLDVAKGIYTEKYSILAELEIRPFTWSREYQGVPYWETRYAIKGYPGAWGYESALRIGLEKAEAQEWRFGTEWIRAKMEQE